MAMNTNAIQQISIHASAKEATVTVNDGLLLQKFQSTPPRRRRQCDPPHYDMDTVFQSTPPRRRRQNSKRIQRCCIKFQSTPPRRRRRTTFDRIDRCFFISIHASAKEATVLCSTIALLFLHFNPRLREGGDRNIL